MQIYLRWTCRECGQDQETRTDTANYGTFLQSKTDPVYPHFIPNPYGLSLTCRFCDHNSGIIGLGYQYKAEHRPSQERSLNL
jgi:hypothetical protein